METKICTSCGDAKALIEFSKNKSTKDGLQYRCKCCDNTCRKAYYDNNKEQQLAYRKAYYNDNLEKVASIQKRWRQANLEKDAANQKAWKQANADKVNADAARRRAAKLRATPCWDEELTNLVAQEAYHLAKLREKVTGFTWHVDHVIPLQGKNVCGLHAWNNFAVIPASENLSKNNSYVME